MLYVANVNEITVNGNSGEYISTFTIASSTGALTPAAGNPVSVGFDPRSRSVYVVNAGAADVSEFSLANSGTLTPLPGSPVAVGGTRPI